MAKLLSKFSAILSVFTVLTFSLGTAMADTSQSAKKTVNIGIYAPFTTQSAYIGRNILGAMEIARDQLKSADINYEFYTLDASSAPQEATNTLQKFIDIHHINVLLTEGVATGTAVAPLATKNNLIHFCLGCKATLTDGKNNFHAHSPNHQRGALLKTAIKPEFVSQFKQEYLSHPVTEAGYAYDLFQLLNSSAVLAMKTRSAFSSQLIAGHLLMLKPDTGLMGKFSLSKKGIVYQKENLIA